MKIIRKLSFLLAVILIISSFLPLIFTAAADDEIADNPGIISGNAIVAYARDENRFLYNYRLDEKVEPAVATKLMACMVVSDILAERKLSAEDVTVTVTQEALNIVGGVIDIRTPTMSLDVNETYTAKDLLSATLVACANDAVASLAVHFGNHYLNGGTKAFVERMNDKAKELGLENTHFENPTGFSASGQYSTPREVALIASAFYGYNDLIMLSDVESFSFDGRTTVHSKNSLKSGKFVSGYTNKNAVGIIGGQLDVNGNYCLIAATQKDGKSYIFVVMCAPGMVVTPDEENEKYYYSYGTGNAYDDMNKLIKWTREAFELVTVTSKDTVIGELQVDLGDSSDHVMIVPSETVECLILTSSKSKIQAVLTYDENVVYKKDFNGEKYDAVQAPIATNQQVGTIVYSIDGVEIAKVNAVVKEGVELDGVKNFFAQIESFLFGPIMKTILIVIGVIIVLYIGAGITAQVMKAKEKSKKAKKKQNPGAKAVQPTEKKINNTDTREMK